MFHKSCRQFIVVELHNIVLAVQVDTKNWFSVERDS